MPSTAKELGSDTWLNQMFADPPAREVKGRTRWTHRHLTWVEALGRLAYVESRNELVGLLALEYLQRLGIIKRLKEQPFTCGEDFLRDYTPDLAAQDVSNVNYVIEVKTKRFVTRAMEKEFEELKEKFSDIGMKFLVWTNHAPLTHPLRHNLLELRRASSEFIQQDETERLVELIKRSGSMPVWALYERDIDLTLISHAVWHGHVHIPLLQRLDAATNVSLEPQEDLSAVLFGTEPDLHQWWNNLEHAA